MDTAALPNGAGEQGDPRKAQGAAQNFSFGWIKVHILVFEHTLARMANNHLDADIKQDRDQRQPISLLQYTNFAPKIDEPLRQSSNAPDTTPLHSVCFPHWLRPGRTETPQYSFRHF